MRVFYTFVLIIFLICVSLNFSTNIFAFTSGVNVLGNKKPKTDSDRTLLEIERIITSSTQNREDLKSPELQKAIVKRIVESFPLNKDISFEKLDLKEIAKRADIIADKKYSLTTDELKRKYMVEAEKKYEPIPLRSKVIVEYKQGRYIHKLTGTFYGFTFRKDGIRIGRTVVPIIDLLPEYRALFDKRTQKKEKDIYVDKKIREYLEEKEKYAMKHIKSMVNTIEKKNEEAGYIYAWNKWRTPKDVADIIIQYYSK